MCLPSWNPAVNVFPLGKPRCPVLLNYPADCCTSCTHPNTCKSHMLIKINTSKQYVILMVYSFLRHLSPIHLSDLFVCHHSPTGSTITNSIDIHVPLWSNSIPVEDRSGLIYQVCDECLLRLHWAEYKILSLDLRKQVSFQLSSVYAYTHTHMHMHTCTCTHKHTHTQEIYIEREGDRKRGRERKCF